MAFDPQALLDAVVSIAATLGRFDRVAGHEPIKNPPGSGLTCASWVQSMRPAPRSSGLSNSSAVVVLQTRIFTNALADPQDGLDPKLLQATHELMTAYMADFSLGGLVRTIDIRGSEGVPVSVVTGYLEQGTPARLYRVMTITLPVIINDMWEETS